MLLMSINGEQLDFTKTEYDLLYLLATNIVLQREQILDHVWGMTVKLRRMS